MAMTKPLVVTDLGLSDQETELQFEKLQAKLIPLWESISGMSQGAQTIVVVPSQSIEFDCQGAEMQAYEERMLYLLLLLRQPRARVIYVTSQTILPATLDYYLSILPGVITSHALQRFFNVTPEDRTPRPLAVKLLERPNICAQIRALIPDRSRAHLTTYCVTTLERDVALRLGIPLYGSDPSLFHLGSKTGSRELFAKAGIAYPAGFEGLSSMDEVSTALTELRRQKPGINNAMVKLNDSISGEGNAVVDMENLPDANASEFAEALQARMQTMQYELPSIDFESFSQSLVEVGGIVEERIQGHGFCSPSVQMRVSPLGDVDILSTHDQLLGGPGGQSFLGSKFPADAGYASLIGNAAQKVGECLADLGALGRFAIDFVALRDESGTWSCYAIEINLRKGGTTHPFEMLQFLTDGSYHTDEGVFRAPSGIEKCYVASDHIESSLYHAFTPSDLFDIVIRHGLHFDQSRQTGILLHMLATVGENGRFGVVAVGDSIDEAEQLYQRIQTVIQDEAKHAIQMPLLPDKA
jgi:hypothetical protein